MATEHSGGGDPARTMALLWGTQKRPSRGPKPGLSVGEAAARLRGRTPLVCRESLRTLLHGHHYDGSKAERELGVSYRPVEETLRRTAAWLVDQGITPARA